MAKTRNQTPCMESHFGRDEMNLVEFPLGPIGKSSKKTIKVDHAVYDQKSKREIIRQVVITGSDEYGLPKAIDDQVLFGMKALTQDAGFSSPKVFFSRHRLCKLLGWSVDGHTYQRIEDSLDRLSGTMLKFKNSWYDKGENEWRSHSFHLIDNFELCSRDRYNNTRKKTGSPSQSLCYFVWNEVVWKSFQDGFIKKVDMKMFRRIANGRRRESPLRLYRWLDKKFYKKRTVVKFDVLNLCNGMIGYSFKFPCDAIRAIERAANVLIDCEFLSSYQFRKSYNGTDVIFRKANSSTRIGRKKNSESRLQTATKIDEHLVWLAQQSETMLFEQETKALKAGFGRKFHHDMIAEERNRNVPVLESSRLRQQYVRHFIESSEKS